MNLPEYAVWGAGAQSEAIVYDLATHGGAFKVSLVDRDPARAHAVAKKVNDLLSKVVVIPFACDLRDTEALKRICLPGIAAVVSAAHYELNPLLTSVAVDIGAHYVDLGGNTSIVRKQRKLDPEAKAANVSVVPDCGMGPGLNLSLADFAMRLVKDPKRVTIYCGGLPRFPKGELNYELLFSLFGLVNEYSGDADELKDGKQVSVPALSGRTWVKIDRIGYLEAAVTTGGLSTAADTWKDRLTDLSYKTLRYPGHWDLVERFAREGKLEERLRERLGTTVGNTEDVGIILVECEGEGGKKAHVELVDGYDPATGLSAMQRLTGFHASIVAIAAARRMLARGVIPVETVDGRLLVDEMAKRNIDIRIS